MHTSFIIDPKASAVDIMEALEERSTLLAANVGLLSGDAFEGFDDLCDETKRTILLGIWREAETLSALAKALSSPERGLRTDPALRQPVRR